MLMQDITFTKRGQTFKISALFLFKKKCYFGIVKRSKRAKSLLRNYYAYLLNKPFLKLYYFLSSFSKRLNSTTVITAPTIASAKQKKPVKNINESSMINPS
jgi:hypothetical protein